MTNEAKVKLLNRALALEVRTFLDYVLRVAPPVDVDGFPEVERALGELLSEEDRSEAEIVAAIEGEGGRLDQDDFAVDMQFTYYNYVTTEYALKVIAENLEARLARLDAIVDEAAADEAVHGFLRPIRDRRAAAIARVRDLRAAVAGAAKQKARGAAAGPQAATAAAPAAESKAAHH
jgi:hypothetical protein